MVRGYGFVGKNGQKIFQGIEKKMEQATEAALSGRFRLAESAIRQYVQTQEGSGTEVQTKNRRRKKEITVRQFVDEGGPIDLKPFFRRSQKARKTEKGGWYLVVPMRIKTYSSRKSTEAGRMSNRQYRETLSKFKELGPSHGKTQTIVSDYLYDNRRPGSELFPELNYEPLSKEKGGYQISATQDERTGFRQYVAFRTVSDKSPANSWILNRETATETNLTRDIRRIINQLSRRNR